MRLPRAINNSHFHSPLPSRHIKPGALTYYKYHGPERKLDLSKQLPNVVLTTYGAVASECGRLNRRSVLTQVHWYRIVLDEGEILQARTNNERKADESVQRILSETGPRSNFAR